MDIDFKTFIIGERIKYLRKEILHLSQKEFGDKIGVSDATISKIEKNLAPLTERNIKSICREFNVSYVWLFDGFGDVFRKPNDVTLEKLTNQYNLNDSDKNLIKEYLQMTDEQREIIKSFIRLIKK